MEENKDKFITDFISSPGKYYLSKISPIDISITKRFMEKDVCFFHIKSITFEEKGPQKEALENVLSTMRLPFINFIYLIKGDKKKVSFYLGVSRDIVQYRKNATDLIDLQAYGDSILKKGIESNFRGSCVEIVDSDSKKDLIRSINKYSQIGVLEGVPGLNKDDTEDFQRVERLIDAMLGDDFMFLVTAKYIPFEGINKLEQKVCNLYDTISPMTKLSVQKGESEGISISSTEGSNRQEQAGTTEGTSESISKSSSETKGGNEGNNKSYSKSTNETVQNGTNKGSSSSITNGTSSSSTKGSNKGHSTNSSLEYLKIEYQNWLKYIENTLLPRIDYGKGIGMFNVAISLFSNDDLTLRKLANISTSLFSGQEGNKVPLLLHSLEVDSDWANLIKDFQIPAVNFKTPISDNEILARTAYSQMVSSSKAFLGNWYSVKELSVIAGLPKKEVVGLSLNEEVEFGLNVIEIDDNKIPLGNLVQSGIERKEIEVALNRQDLSRHIFICGVTGSGKTTTCMSILLESKTPFLVIEPVKTEYRVLANKDKFPNLSVTVFTLGDEKVAPFRFNPLEFLPSETISSHVDMVKASIEAAFDMEAAIPSIIEEALYKCYENYGWNIRTNINERFKDPFAPGVNSFPTISDFIKATHIVIEEQGFDERLKNDYKGSLSARLNVLTLGAKGLMLDVPRSVDFSSLIKQQVVFELENIKSGSEKSLIMGFLLSALNEAIKNEFKKDNSFSHITLVEEAHRLLSKYSPGDSPNKKNGVEVFADMLAEIRKYGESLIIADQIPNKMTPEVLKNTNTKIVHKIFAQDDKEAIGNTMSLSDSQKSFLSNLSVGRAVTFSQGWSKSIQVQIKRLVDTSNDSINPATLRKRAMNFYAKEFKRGMMPELACLEKEPSPEKTEMIFQNMNLFYNFRNSLVEVLAIKKTDKNRQKFMENLSIFDNYFKQLKEIFKPKEVINYLITTVFDNEEPRLIESLTHFITDLHHGSIIDNSIFVSKYSYLNNQSNLKKV